MRNMSFSLTEAKFLDGSKTVTRRLGWKFLKPGDFVCGVRKAMGLKKGEKIHRLGVIRVLRVGREAVWQIVGYDESRNGKKECAREGFPNLSPSEFIDMFCHEMKCKITTTVTRIVFEHVTEANKRIEL